MLLTLEFRMISEECLIFSQSFCIFKELQNITRKLSLKVKENTLKH